MSHRTQASAVVSTEVFLSDDKPSISVMQILRARQAVDLSYSTYLGGHLYDSVAAIAIDDAGNAYLTGLASSRDFPTTDGAFQRTCKRVVAIAVQPCWIAFVTKINSTATSILYSTFLGGKGFALAALDGVSSTGEGIAVDQSGFAYVTGPAYTTDFPTTSGSLKPTTTTRDAFVSKMNLDGSGLVYSTYLGGDFVGAVQSTFGAGSRDAYVAKLNPEGSALTFSTYLGGGDYDQAFAVAIDASGAVYVAGLTGSNDFPVVNPFQSSLIGLTSSFVTKISIVVACGRDVTSQLDVLQSRFHGFFFGLFQFQWCSFTTRRRCRLRDRWSS